MYVWWNSYVTAWWQESLSQSYTEALEKSTPDTSQAVETPPSLTPEATEPSSAPTPGFGFEDWALDQALCQLDESLCTAKVSRNFPRVTGLQSPDTNFEFLSLIREDARNHFLYCMQEVIFSDTKRVQPMLRVRLAQRPENWLQISGMRNKQGVLLSLRDITQEMHLERELVRARINAELAQRARSEFLGRMSHELRTPLNAVIGFAQMIDDQVAGPVNHPTYEEYLSSIRQSGEQLLDKINNLLAISEAELGAVELSEENVPLVSLLRSASEHHQHFAFSKDVQLTLAVQDETCPTIRVDKGLMAKALSNLIENAIACTRPQGCVQLECEIDAKGCVLIHIRDTGIGMNESLVRCLSDFFDGRYSSNNYYERIPLGTGLTLTREYVQLHDGKLEVSSIKGEGALFTVRLPVTRLVSLSSMPSAPGYYRETEAIAV
jgi:signal transduction histidine kinase